MDEFTNPKVFGGIKLNIAYRNYINQIIREIDGSDIEKADIAEEIEIHLQLSSEYYMKAGYEKKEAEKLAMNEFGKTNEIGKQMQEAIFPYRKIMFIMLIIASFLYTYSVYTAQLFLEGDAFISWLIIAVFSTSLLLLFVLRVFPKLDRKITLNSVLILHVFTFGYGTFLASSLESKINIFFEIFSWAILLGTIVLIYRTSIIDFEKGDYQLSKHKKVIHFLNITYGIVVIYYTLFFTIAIIAFSELSEIIHPRLAIFFIPLSIWLIAYYIQIKLLKNYAKFAYLVAIIPAIMLITITLWFFS